MLDELRSRFEKDRMKGYTTIGPHRDELKFLIDGKDVGRFGSSGQQRITVLALKASEVQLFREYKGDYPVLLLDDIDSELDIKRIKKVFNLLSGDLQTIVTSTKTDLLNRLKISSRKMIIESGSVSKIIDD